MATIVERLPQPAGALIWLRDFLRSELAPYPGRVALVARMTITVTLVMIINMTFRIPFGAYGAIYALTISRENPETTVKAVKTIILAFALSILYILIGAAFFLQEPDLRLFWVIATMFVMFYTLSAAVNYSAATRFGYLLVITIPLWDRQISTEVKVEQTLWAFGAISLASLFTVAVELIYARFQTRDALLQPLADRLAVLEDMFGSYATGQVPDEKTEKQIVHFALAGNSALRRTLQRSTYTSQYREQMGAVVSLVGRQIDIAANMLQLTMEIPDHQRSRARQMAADLGKIHADLLAGRCPRLERNSETETLHSVPLLGEMERTVWLIPEIFAGSASLDAYALPRSSDDSALSLFKPDALTNPEHIRFGLKGCLAASLCYVIYNGKAWPGISTAITTCLLTALSTIGSSHQKQVLRICGAIAGGVVMGIGAEVFILPALDSIAGFTLLIIAVTIIAAWFATSSPRLSYFGVQIAVAFYLINLSEFRVQTSLTPARDRVVGILLGLGMMWLVFDQLWGAPAAIQMKKTFISNLRLVAEFLREPASGDQKKAMTQSFALRETLNSSLDKVRSLADGVLFEFGPSREQDLALRDRIRRLQPILRMLFITRLVLWKYRVRLPGFELPEAVHSAQEEFDNRLATALEGMADRMQGTVFAQKEDLTNAYQQLEEAAEKALPNEQRELTPQLQSFLILSRRIADVTDSLQKEI